MSQSSSSLRHRFFSGLQWYEALEKPNDPKVSSAWYLAKRPDSTWPVALLEHALDYARHHSLEDTYRRRFADISEKSLTHERAQAEGRRVTDPIWQIAVELVAARFLDRVCHWKLLRHEPQGDKECVGDWEFATPHQQSVFVEVKYLQEPETIPTTTMVAKPDYRPKIRSSLARAYRQLPADGRATLVVLFGDESTELVGDVLTSAIFEALFGTTQVTFTIEDPDSMAIGPSLHDMFVQVAKHRRMGAVAGLTLRGLDIPNVQAHAVHNPFAYPQVRLRPEGLEPMERFYVNGEGKAVCTPASHAHDVWRHFVAV